MPERLAIRLVKSRSTQAYQVRESGALVIVDYPDASRREAPT